MKTFDISVNVLNDKGLSDKFLWKERTHCQAYNSHGVSQQKSVLPHVVDSTPISLQISKDMSTSTFSRTSQIPLEISLLTLPCTFFFAFVMLLLTPQIDSAEKISTIIGCALLLATPAVLLVWHQRTPNNKYVYVHMLLIHEFALLVVLRPETIWTVSLIFVILFAHLCLRHPSRRIVCIVIILLNIATAVMVVTSQQITGSRLSPATELIVVLCSACIILTSVATYACIAVVLV